MAEEANRDPEKDTAVWVSSGLQGMWSLRWAKPHHKSSISKRDQRDFIEIAGAKYFHHSIVCAECETWMLAIPLKNI